MTDHRVELRVTFTVDDRADGGRWAAHEILRQLHLFGTRGALDGLTSDFEAAPGTVDGIGWYEKWALMPAPGAPDTRAVADSVAYTAGVLGSALAGGTDGHPFREAVTAAATALRMLADELATGEPT